MPKQFSGSTTVKAEGLVNAFDRQIWDYAGLHNFTIVTQDSDFNDLSILFGFPPKIIWLRTGNLKITAILDVLVRNYSDLTKFEADNELACFEIVLS